MFLKTIKKFSLITILLFLLPAPVKASHPTYNYDTAGNYKWYKNGNYLVNEIDAYKDKKLTKLNIFYNNPVKGVMYTGDEDSIGSDNKLGNFTAYVLTSTSNDQNSSDFSVNNVGTYYVLFNEDAKKVYDIVHIPNPLPYAYVNRYKFWIGGNETKEVYFLHSEGGGDNWYGDYLAKIGTEVKNKKPGLTTVVNAPQPPAFSGASATGSITSNSNTSSSTDTSNSTGSCGYNCPKMPDRPALPPDEDIPTISESLKMGNIATAWALVLDIVNVLAIFVLLAIAFANILHLGERDSFSYKRMLPAFIIGLIAANLSHLICRAIIDFSGMLMNFFVPKAHAFDTIFNIMIGMFSGWFGNTGTMEWGIAGAGIIATAVVGILAGGGCGLIIIGLIILLFPAIAMFVLMFLLAARTYVLWFLVILSPIAFFGMFFDPLKRTIGTWWNWFLMWTFMGPIAYFFIYLAEAFARNTEGITNVGCLDPTDPNQVGGFTKYLIVNVLLILAVYVPYALGAKIGMGLWGSIGKFLGTTGLKMGFGAGGGAIEKIGQKKGWKGWQNLGKSVRQVPYLPGAIFGKEGVLENMNKASTKEAQTDIEKRLKTKLPSLMREQNRESIVKNGSEWKGSAEGFKNGAISAIGSGREDLLGSNLRAMGIKAQTDNDQSERIKAAELLRKEFGVSVEEATMCGFGDIHDPTNAVTISKEFARKNREEKKQAKTEGRKPRDAAELRAEIDDKTLPSVEDQFKSGMVPEQAVGIYKVDDPNRFKKPSPPSNLADTWKL